MEVEWVGDVVWVGGAEGVCFASRRRHTRSCVVSWARRMCIRDRYMMWGVSDVMCVWCDVCLMCVWCDVFLMCICCDVCLMWCLPDVMFVLCLLYLWLFRRSSHFRFLLFPLCFIIYTLYTCLIHTLTLTCSTTLYTPPLSLSHANRTTEGASNNITCPFFIKVLTLIVKCGIVKYEM